MAAKTKTAETPKGMTAAQRAPIVKAWTDSVKTLSTVGGELVERIVSVAKQTLSEDYEVTTADAHALSADAARVTGWKKDKHGKWGSRASEIKHLVSARAKLGAAIKDCRKSLGACTWHDAVALAKALNDGKSQAAAIKLVKGKRSGGESEPATPDKAKAQAAKRIKPMLAWGKLPREFKAQLRQLCAEHHINV